MIGTQHLPDHLAIERHRHGRGIVGDLTRERIGGRQQLVGFVNRAYEAALECLFRAEDTAGHHPFKGLLRTDEARQEPARARLHHDGAACEDETVACRLGRQPHIHRQLHGDPDAHGRPVASCDGGLQRVIEAEREQTAAVAMTVEAGIDRAAVLGVEGVGAAREIGAGAKAAARAGEDDRAHVIVAVGAIHGVEQLRQHLAGESVELVGTVQGDGEDAALGIVLDRLVGHGRSVTSD